MTSIILLNKNCSMSLCLFLPLPALVTPVSLLDHPCRLIKFSLFSVWQTQSAEIGFSAILLLHLLLLVILTVTDNLVLTSSGSSSFQLKLKLQEIIEIGSGWRRWRRVRGEAAARRTRGTRLSVHVGDGGRAATALAVRIEELAGVEGLIFENQILKSKFYSKIIFL